VYLLLSLFIGQSILVRDFTVCMFFVLQSLFLNCRTFGLALLGDMIAQHLSGIVYCRSLYSGTEPPWARPFSDTGSQMTLSA
jgi:hypothetical protein